MKHFRTYEEHSYNKLGHRNQEVRDNQWVGSQGHTFNKKEPVKTQKDAEKILKDRGIDWEKQFETRDGWIHYRKDAEWTNYDVGIDPRTNKPYINLNTTPENIAEQITKWREAIIREKIEFIVNEAPTLKDYKTKAAKWEYQGSAIEQDMVEFLTEYSFIEPPKGFRTQLKQDSINSPRGGKPIEYRPPTWKNKLK